MGGNPHFPFSSGSGHRYVAPESNHNQGTISSPHLPSSKWQWQAYQQARLYWQTCRKLNPSSRGGNYTPIWYCTAAAVKILSPAAAKLQESSSLYAPVLSITGALRKNGSVDASLHMLHQTSSIQGKPNKGMLFSGFTSYRFYHAKELFWSRILQVVSQQCSGAWDEGVSFN